MYKLENQDNKHIHYLQETALCNPFPTPSLTFYSLALTHQLSVIIVHISRVLPKGNHILCTVSCLDLFTKNKYFEILACHTACQLSSTSNC